MLGTCEAAHVTLHICQLSQVPLACLMLLRCGAAACVSAAFVFASLPAMALYRAYGHISLGWNVLLMAFAGCCVNGPYALITTAVSADLGNHSSVAGAGSSLSRA